MSKSPFKFLDSYSREDKEIFFGREREIEELYQKVFESKILLMYGISGTGKTSIINCGLANKFEDSDWLPMIIRRGANINDSLSHGIAKLSLTTVKKKQSISRQLQSLYLDHFKPIYIILDQFEELFIFGDKEERDEFIQTVKQVVDSDVQCRFIFSIREEYLAGVTEFEHTIPNFLSNRIRIERMTWVNAKRVIEEPCRVNGIEVEEGLAETILGKLNPESTDVELTYLQVLLDKIYRVSVGKDEEKPEFTNDLLQQIGDVSDLLGSFLEDQVNQLKDPDTGLILLKSFVSIKGTKRQVTFEDISEFAETLGKKIQDDELKKLIIRFVNLRILRGKDESGRYELRHDSLAAKIYEKITLVEKELLEVRQFIENAHYNYKKRDIFLSLEDLRYILPYEDRMFLHGELNDFVNQSKHHLNARKRSFNKILRFSAIGFFIIIFVVIFYSFKSSGGIKLQKLTLSSFLQKDFSLTLSFQEATKAYRKDTTSTFAIKTLFDSFYALLEGGPYYDSLGNEINPGNELFNFKPCSSEISYAKFSEDGEYIYGYLDDNRVKIWTIHGEEVFSKGFSDTAILSVKLAPNNELITALLNDSTVCVWKLSGELVCSLKASYEPLNPINVVSFSPAEAIFSCIGINNQINIYDSTGNFLYELSGHSAPINATDFSPNGKYIVSGSKDSTIIIWSLDSLSGKYQNVKQISGFEDAVWSVEFAKNSKYILCTSTDTSSFEPNVCHICDFNGDKRGMIYACYDTAFLNKDTLNYDYRVTGKVVSARFSNTDAAIIVTTFNEGMPPKKNDSQPVIEIDDTRYRISFSENSLRNIMTKNRALKGYSNPWYFGAKRNENVFYFSGIDFSKLEYVAASFSGKEDTYLYHWDRLPLAKFKGNSPVFSPDGKYLLCLESNILHIYPSDEKELIRLVEEELLFGELELNIRDWLDFFKLEGRILRF